VPPPRTNLPRVPARPDRRAAMSKFFYALGLAVARRPGRTIALCVAVTALCALGFLRFRVETDSSELFTPTDARSFFDRDVLKAAGYRDDESARVNIIGVTKSTDGGNLLTRDALLEYLGWYEALTSAAAAVSVGGKSYLYADYCTPGEGGGCRVDSVLSIWGFSRATLAARSDAQVLADINASSLRLSSLVGGLTRDGSSGAITAAKALQSTVYLISRPYAIVTGVSKSTFDPVQTALDERLLAICTTEWAGPSLRLYVDNDAAVDAASSAAIQKARRALARACAAARCCCALAAAFCCAVLLLAEQRAAPLTRRPLTPPFLFTSARRRTCSSSPSATCSSWPGRRSRCGATRRPTRRRTWRWPPTPPSSSRAAPRLASSRPGASASTW